MWDGVEGKFWTGTNNDGSPNKAVVPLDCQTWAVLGLKLYSAPEYREHLRCLTYCEQHHKVTGQTACGFDFNTDKDSVLVPAGSAQMALAYKFSRQAPNYRDIMKCLKAAQEPSGGLSAASIDGLTTGFFDLNGQPWLYYRRSHVGATAWLVLADYGLNSFWMEKSLFTPPMLPLLLIE